MPGNSAEPLFVLGVTVGLVVLVIAIQVAILRWIFRVNDIVRHQIEIRDQLGRLYGLLEGRTKRPPAADHIAEAGKMVGPDDRQVLAAYGDRSRRET